jgi:small redox-active disulfide protein 2
MIFFKKKKEEKKEECGCGCSCGTNSKEECCTPEKSDARFIVLGACCAKSTDTFNNVKQAVKEMGFTDEVVNIGDAAVISTYGVMSTPALVVDGKVVSVGRPLKVEDVKKIFLKLGVK